MARYPCRAACAVARLSYVCLGLAHIQYGTVQPAVVSVSFRVPEISDNFYLLVYKGKKFAATPDHVRD